MSRRGIKGELERWLLRRNPQLIGEPEWDELRQDLSPVSETYLRKLLRESGVALAPLVEGVRQESFDALQASLEKMLAEYQNGDPARKVLVRRAVITAKDHARLAARNDAKRAEKQEMALWMLTWLENPPVFAEWVRLRRLQLAL
jgi:hypothetical protein